MHGSEIILTLTAALSFGLAFGYITQRIGLSPIVGYLVAGVAIGPFTPGFTADQKVAEQLAEVGVMLLMFGVGLHFHVRELLAVRSIALPGAILQVAVATGLGALVALAAGLSLVQGVVFGLCLSVASTVVLTRMLVDNRQLHTPMGHVAVGWLIVEDIFTVLVLVVLPALWSSQASTADQVLVVGMLGLKLVVLAVGMVVVGTRVVPWLFGRVARSSSRELFTLAVLVAALGIAVGIAAVFEVSVALGAFLAGMCVGRSEYSVRVASEAIPLRDAFAALFFVSVGMLLNPASVINNWHIVTATVGVVVIGKALAAFVIVIALGHSLHTALGVSVALAQIGEFSFILASLARELAILDGRVIDLLVATSIITITLNPVLFRALPWFERRCNELQWLRRVIEARMAKTTAVQSESESRSGEVEQRAVVVGYGPIGRSATRLLRENGIAATVIELNVDTARELRRAGISVVYGDASRREVLEEAGAAQAETLLLTASSFSSPQEIVRVVREINPRIRVIARASYAKEMAALRAVGCEAVYSGEGEVALALTEEVLRSLGANAEQIERERERVRAMLG